MKSWLKYGLNVWTLSAVMPLSAFFTIDSSPTPSSPKPQPGQTEIEPDLFRKDQWVVFTNVEYLFWTVNESALDYAIKMRKPSWSTTQTYATGNYKNATFGWDSGARLAVGYFNAPHYWDVFAQYTYLHASGKNKTHAPSKPDLFLNGTWIGPDFNTTDTASPLQEAKSRIDLFYNVVDGFFSRRFIPNPHFRLNIYGGVSIAFMHQSWHVHYTDLLNEHSKIKNRWSFAGAGPRLGVTLDWFIRDNFYITGNISNALLSGKYKNWSSQKTDATVSDANNTLPLRDTHFHDMRLTYTSQFFVGPSWQKSFKNMRTGIWAGYELTFWTNLHEIYRSSLAGPTASKDTYINSSVMTLQGVTLKWNLDF